MIRVDRPAAPPIPVFSKKTAKAANGRKLTAAELELEEAIAFHTNPAHFKNNVRLTKKEFPFKVYKNRELAKALGALFASKCAYCESRFAHVAPRDIEHFRPKSRVDTGGHPLSPGYYWLAGEWTNLLVSCIHCNRAQKHQVPGEAKERRIGKRDQFPLVNEATRIRHHAQPTTTEAVLLLDPCTDDPEQHLRFDDQGLVHPLPDTTNQPSPRGRISIDVYALQRKDLVNERKQVLDDAKSKILQLNHLVVVQNGVGSGTPLAAANLAQIQLAKEALRRMFQPTAPYQAMLRGLVRTAKAAGELDLLLQFGIDLETLIKAKP